MCRCLSSKKSLYFMISLKQAFSFKTRHLQIKLLCSSRVKLDSRGPVDFRGAGAPQTQENGWGPPVPPHPPRKHIYQSNVNAILIMLRKKRLNMYVHHELVAFTEHKQKSKKKMLFISWGWGPLGGWGPLTWSPQFLWQFSP